MDCVSFPLLAFLTHPCTQPGQAYGSWGEWSRPSPLMTTLTGLVPGEKPVRAVGLQRQEPKGISRSRLSPPQLLRTEWPLLLNVPFPFPTPFPPRNQSDPCPQKPWSAGGAWTGAWDSVVSGEQLCGARRGLLPVKEPGKWHPDPVLASGAGPRHSCPNGLITLCGHCGFPS